jgi:hypothetical protein
MMPVEGLQSEDRACFVNCEEQFDPVSTRRTPTGDLQKTVDVEKCPSTMSKSHTVPIADWCNDSHGEVIVAWSQLLYSDPAWSS